MKSEKLAIEGGKPVRTKPLPLEFPGVHHMDAKEVQAAVRLLKARSPFRYYGVKLQKEVEKLEAELARFYGAKHAIAVASGTGALQTALSALGVGPGQEVIVPAYMWVSVLAAVVNHGAIPVIADIDSTFCFDPADVARRITPKTTGIIMVHMSGAPGNVKAIQKLARERKLWLLEDCAQCNGGSVGGKKVGTFGDVGIFSFQMNKNMTAGEGGAIVTNDFRLYRRAFACHDLGYARDANGRLIFDDPDLRLWGMGYRLDELRGAVLRVQLKKLPRIIKSMQRSKYRVRKALEKFSGVQLRKIQDPAGDTSCFLITTYADAATARNICAALRAEGIVTHPQGVSNVVMTDWGLHLYTNNVSLVHRSSVDGRGFPWALVENAGLGAEVKKGLCPAADALFERSVLIPIPSCLTKRDEDDIIRAFQKVLGRLLPQ
ncbi:MAG: aminotransferase class I/II-fold pyridoxal phosphate-dependent enzyme [Terriglobia bacterium]